MRRSRSCVRIAALATALSLLAVSAIAQTTLGTGNNAAPPATPGSRPPTRADILRGEYGRYRANNDLLLLRPRRPRRSGQEVHLRQEHHPLPDAEGRHPHPARSLRQPRRRQDPVRRPTPLKYQRELNTVFVDFPGDAAGRPRLRDRLPLLGHAARDGPVRRLRVRQGPRRQPLDHHRVRRAGRQHLVAEQGPVARRARRAWS